MCQDNKKKEKKRWTADWETLMKGERIPYVKLEDMESRDEDTSQFSKGLSSTAQCHRETVNVLLEQLSILWTN